MYLPTDSKVARRRAILITAQWGLGSAARFTNWTENLDISPFSWVARPEMEIDLGKRHGGTDDETFSFLIPPETPFTDQGEAGAFPSVFATVEEIDPDDFTQRRVLLQGSVSTVTKNPGDNREGMIEVTCNSHKSRLAVPLGLMVTTTCPWIFGDANTCQYSLSGKKINVTVTGISHKRLVVTALDTIVKKPAYYWRAGTVLYDALSIQITSWRAGNQFVLADAPPAYWDGKAVTLIPGCDKKVGTCSKVWNNTDHFGGCGIVIPPYYPLAETR